MRSSWPWQGKKSPRVNIATGGILLVFGLWDLFFVLFRSEDVLFTASAALLLLASGIQLQAGDQRFFVRSAC